MRCSLVSKAHEHGGPKPPTGDPKFLKELAEALVGSHLGTDWFAPIDLDSQVWLGRETALPQRSDFKWDYRPFGAGVSKPLRALWTSTNLKSGESYWLRYVRLGEDGYLPPYRQMLLKFGRQSTVFEVDSPQAWRNLCLDFLAPTSEGKVEPDWEAASRVWDGIHVSVGGLLSAQGVKVEDVDSWSELRGWDCESTVWLRWPDAELIPLDPVWR